MQAYRLGKSDIAVSRLGLGTVKFGRNTGVKYPVQFKLPTDDEIKQLLSIAADLGINLLDTAPAYGDSEERLGKLLSNRHEWVLCTKAGEEFIAGESQFDFSPQAITKSIERSLKRLRTDYLDVVLIHSDGNDRRLIEAENIFATLEEVKKSGKIRAFGMSTKTVQGGLLTIDHADIAMVTFNATDQADREVIQYAQQKQKNIFVKKAFASGHLEKLGADPIANAMQFIFTEPGVTSVIVGTLRPEHLKQNVAALEKVLG